MKSKKLLFCLGIIFFALLFFKPQECLAITESEVAGKLAEIQNKSGYREGEKYVWNDAGYFSDYCNAQNGYHASVGYSNMGYQCYAYGQDLFDQIFRQCSTCHANTSYDLTKLMAGDVIRLSYGHTIIVTACDGYSVQYTDANANFDGVVHWNKWTDVNYLAANLSWVSHADNYSRGDTQAPTVSDAHIHSQSIGTDSVKFRFKVTDNVGVKEAYAKVWQTGNSSNSGTTKKAYSIGNQYYEVEFKATDAKKVGENLCCVQAWAYDNAGNESGKVSINDFVFGQKANLGDSFVARIVSKNSSNYCIGISGTNNGDDLKVKTKSLSDDSQLWSFKRNSDGTYKIINIKANKSMDTDGGEGAKGNGVKIQLWSYSSTSPQMQFIIQTYNGGYRIVPTNQAVVRGIDVPGGSFTNNADIEIYDACTKDNKAQTWVFEKVATSISMNVNSANVRKGETKQLSVTFNPTSVATKTLKWTTSNSSIATVSSTGVVKGIKEGTVTITATTTDGSNKKATCTIKIILPFKDVEPSDWSYSAIKYMYDNGYMSGASSTKFAPKEKLTRGMLVTILHNMEGRPYVSGKCSFSDVQDTQAYYYSAIKWASRNGIVSGYPNGKFGPNDPIKRQDLAVILNQYCRYKGKYKKVIANFSQFSDSNKIESYAKWGMNWAVGTGVITGSNGKLNPQGTATREEVASMIYKYCLNIK